MSTCKRRPQTQTPTPNEDDGLLQTKLREFDATLNKLPTSTNVSKAMSDCPDYSDAMKLVFLRCEVFNVELAVRRFVAYWETRVEVFGEHAFSSLLGLANDDHEAMKCKYTQVAERCDEAGRAILLLLTTTVRGETFQILLFFALVGTQSTALFEKSRSKRRA